MMPFKQQLCNNFETDSLFIVINDTYRLAPIIEKSFSSELVETNTDATVIITVENRNSVDLTLQQDFLDNLPAGMVISGAATSDCGTINSTVGDTIITLVEGSVLSPGICTIQVPVQAATAGANTAT